MADGELRFRRLLIKLSGEALMGSRPFGIVPAIVDEIASEIVAVHRLGAQVGLVVGGGNIIRGVSAHEQGIDRVTGDSMGMLATVINALALSSAIERKNVPTRVQTAIEMHQVAEPFIRRRAVRHLEKGRVVVFAGGTGNPFFTTDTAAALRASEIQADVMIKATKVDGLYTDDPVTNPDAELVRRASFHDVLSRRLDVMDAAAVSLCENGGIPLMIVNIHDAGVLQKVVRGEVVGSLIGPGEGQ